MASLAQKLGLKVGQTICLLEATPETAQVIRAACDEVVGDDVTIGETLDGAPFDLIFYWPRELEGLAERFAMLQRQIVSNGGIWVVVVKKAVCATAWPDTNVGRRAGCRRSRRTWWTTRTPASPTRSTARASSSARNAAPGVNMR